MASKIVAACFAMLVMVVAAHEGHEHMPGMVMPPAPTPQTNSSALFSPSMVMVGFFAFMVSLLAVRKQV
ncbi:conserved hypothetical protein [Ricinus communis]|uniref:Transmembrane protein n=1 Tax=Ricinus communis TaxID=3988 RepID=B9S2J8_RICCO|nr:conserved hypothetical protein [Ricinus communis]